MAAGIKLNHVLKGGFILKMQIAFIVIFSVILVSGCVNNYNTSVSNATFENQWVKFEYPSYIKIVDNSNSTLDLTLYDENILVGTIFFNEEDKNKIASIYPDASNTKIAGQEAITGNDEENLFAYVFLPNNSQGNYTLKIDINNGYTDVFNKTAHTLVIKKI